MTCFSREKRVFCVLKTVFKTFSVFPSTFCDCSLSSPFLSQLKLTQTLHVTLSNSIFALFHLQIFKKKVWVLISSPHNSCFELHFREYLCCCFVFFFCYGFVLFFEIFLVWFVEVLFLCELISVDRFMYYHVLVSLR